MWRMTNERSIYFWSSIFSINYTMEIFNINNGYIVAIVFKILKSTDFHGVDNTENDVVKCEMITTTTSTTILTCVS